MSLVDESFKDLTGVHMMESDASMVGCVRMAALVERSDEVKSETGHVALRAALIEHLRSVRGET